MRQYYLVVYRAGRGERWGHAAAAAAAPSSDGTYSIHCQRCVSKDDGGLRAENNPAEI